MNKLVYLLTAAYLCTLLPFLVSDATRWDHNAHIYEAELQAEQLPVLDYWNFGDGYGYAPYTSYSILPKLLTALLGSILGFQLAYKLLVLTAWLSVPLTIHHHFSGKSEHRVSMVTVVACTLPLIVTRDYGFDIHSAAVVGNFASILAFPFAIFTLTQLDRKNYVLAALLFATTLLTHVLTGIVLLVIILSYVWYDTKALTTLLGLSSTGFWLVPFFLDGYYSVTPYIASQWYGIIITFLSWLVLTALIIFAQFEVGPKYLAFSGITGLFLLVLHSWTYTDIVPMHYHRLYPFLALLFLSILGQRITLENTLVKRIFVVIFVLTAGITTISLITDLPRDSPQAVEKGGNTVFFEALPQNQQFWHNPTYDTIRNGSRAIPGMFVEAHRTRELVFELQRVVSDTPTGFWGGPFSTFSTDTRRQIEQNKSLFYELLSFDTVLEKTCSDAPTCYEKQSVNTSMVRTPRKVQPLSDAPNTHLDWLQRPGLYSTLTYEGDRTFTPYRVLDERQKIRVHPTSNTTYIAIQPHTGWNAETLQGEELQIHEVQPVGMIIRSDDPFYLQYTSFRFTHVAGIAISLPSLLTLLILYRRNR